MTSPSEPEQHRSDGEGVNLGKDAPQEEQPFDPYRFGKPDHPIPAEYAPPGYTGPTTPPPTPYGGATGAGNPYGRPTDNPFGNPPGTPYEPSQYPQYPQYPPQQPYGYGPPPPHYSPYDQPRGHGKAVAALVLGICSIVFCWLSLFDAIFVVLGLIFALIAMAEARTPGRGGRGMAVAGLICTIVGAVLATLFTVWIVHAANQCGGFSNSNVPGWNQCVRDHL
jgi:hypothetical protein